MLEQPRQFKARQPAGRDHLPHRFLEIGAQRKPDASHAGVGFQVDLHPPSGGPCRIAQGLGLLGGIAAHRDVVCDQGVRLPGLDMAQHQDGQGQPRPAQLQRFGQAAHRQPGRPLFRQNAGALHRTVAVAVGLHHRAQGHLPGPLADGAEILPQGVQVDLGPDVVLKYGCLHQKPLSLFSGQARLTPSTRFTMSLMDASLVRPET